MKSDYKRSRVKTIVIAAVILMALSMPLISTNSFFLNMLIMSGLWAILGLALHFFAWPIWLWGMGLESQPVTAV